MKFKRLCVALSLTVFAGSAAIGTAAASAATPVTISEGGSTLVYPLAFDWSQAYEALSGNTVDTASVGSGAGITGVCNGTYDIGASDAPLGYPGVKECGAGTTATYSGYVEIPWALSATGLLYHIKLSDGKYLSSGLDLTSTDLVDIYTGKYTKWSQIPSPTQTVTKSVAVYKTKKVWKFKKVHGKKVWVYHKVDGKKQHVLVKKRVKVGSKTETVNQKISLPATAITPVYRSDGSGDSYAFTNFMSLSNSSWNSAYGPSTSFPTGASTDGVGSSGNAGVANSVIHTTGAIGYVSVYYLISTLGDFNGLGVAAIKNAAGHYEFPNDQNISDAASSVTTPPAQNSNCQYDDPHASSDCFGMIIQYPSKSYSIAYPISTYTYAIVPKTGLGSVASTVQDFLDYAVESTYQGEPGGLNTGNAIGFVPLTSKIQSYDKTIISQIGS